MDKLDKTWILMQDLLMTQAIESLTPSSPVWCTSILVLSGFGMGWSYLYLVISIQPYVNIVPIIWNQ